MKSTCFVLFLLLLIGTKATAQERQSFQFVDLGIGTGALPDIHGAVNLAYSAAVISHLGFFADFNTFITRKEILFHELSAKIGPIFRLKGNSYVAMSTGVSYFVKTAKMESWDQSQQVGVMDDRQADKVFSLPVQLKLNIGVYRSVCMGFKATYNYVSKEEISDKRTIEIFVGFRLKG